MADFSKYDLNIFKFINVHAIKNADKNGDNVVLSGEFANYYSDKMQSSDWNGEALSVNEEKDILKNFFSRMIDNNKAKGKVQGYENIANEFAADSNEQNSLGEKIKNFNKFLEGIKKCPDYIIEKNSWENAVLNKLITLCNKDFSNFENVLQSEDCRDIYCEITANMLLKQCLEDKNLNNKKFGDKTLATLLAEDPMLTEIINNYVKQLCFPDNTQFDESQLENDIKGIINEYFDWAGINYDIKIYDGDGDATNDVSAEYTGNINELKDDALTPLQHKIADTEICSRIINKFKNDYIDYVSEFKKYAQSFVNDVLSGKVENATVQTGSWEGNLPDWDSLAALFEMSKQKEELDKYIESLKTPPEIEEEPDVESEPEVDETPEVESEPEVDEEKRQAGNYIYQALGYLYDSSESGMDGYWNPQYTVSSGGGGLQLHEIDTAIQSLIAQDLRQFVEGAKAYQEQVLDKVELSEYLDSYPTEIENAIENTVQIYYGQCRPDSYFKGVTIGGSSDIYGGPTNYYSYEINNYIPRGIFVDELKKQFQS